MSPSSILHGIRLRHDTESCHILQEKSRLSSRLAHVIEVRNARFDIDRRLIATILAYGHWLGRTFLPAVEPDETGAAKVSKENRLSKTFGIVLAASLGLIAVLFAISLSGSDGESRHQLLKSAVVAADSLREINPEYVGSKKCRICHLNIYKSWQSTKHARAIDALGSENRDSVECLGCHTTGTKADGSSILSVGCEACHGPGSDYRKMRIMKNEELAVQRGLLLQTEAVCVRCHNEKCPSFADFDYSAIDFKKVHLIPSHDK